MKILIGQGKWDEALTRLGDFVLKEARRAILIRIAVGKKSESDNPPPSPGSGPSAGKRPTNREKRTASFVEDELDLLDLPDNLVKT